MVCSSLEGIMSPTRPLACVGLTGKKPIHSQGFIRRRHPSGSLMGFVEIAMLGYARHLLRFLALASLMLAGPSLRPASGQLAPIDPLRQRSDSAETPKAMVTATAEFSRPDASGKSVLSVTAKIAKGWH